MTTIYSIEFDNNHFINPLYIDELARSILNEYNNIPKIKSISYINDMVICATAFKQPKKLIKTQYDEHITINFYPEITNKLEVN